MKNGVIKLGEDFVIDKSFTVDRMKKLGDKYPVEMLSGNGVYASYKTKPFKYLNKNVIFVLSFEGNEISRVGIYFFKPSSAWSESVVQEEKDKKLDQDLWLKQIFGRDGPYCFPWGKVESLYDQRSCSSSIVVSFLVK